MATKLNNIVVWRGPKELKDAVQYIWQELVQTINQIITGVSGGTDEVPLTVIQFRRADAADWTSSDPTLADGEPGFERDTGKLKIGNGTDPWTTLPYV